MRKKLINTFLCLIVIAVAVGFGYGNFRRYKADMYFDQARKVVPHFAVTREGGEYIRWAYWEAIRLNPLELYNYECLLTKTYLQFIYKEIKKQKG